MRTSTDRVLTRHVGSRPRQDGRRHQLQKITRNGSEIGYCILKSLAPARSMTTVGGFVRRVYALSQGCARIGSRA